VTVRVVPDDAAGRAEAVRTLRAGGVVGLPTDTVYGIGVDLRTPGGVERLFAIKDRPPERAIMVLVDELAQVTDLVTVPDPARQLAERHWPGGLTLVLPLLPGAPVPPALVAGTRTLGVRLPAHPSPRALARDLGPLPTTSANRSGEPDARSAEDVTATLGERLELLLDGGPSPGGVPSTVVDCTGATARLIRVGAVAPSELERTLGTALEAGPSRD
jgi:L-threonylcarbamoyladenylate synthase